jgi:hypothetical protein
MRGEIERGLVLFQQLLVNERNKIVFSRDKDLTLAISLLWRGSSKIAGNFFYLKFYEFFRLFTERWDEIGRKTMILHSFSVHKKRE